MRSSFAESSTDIEEEIRWLSDAQYPDADWLAQIYRAAMPISPPVN